MSYQDANKGKKKLEDEAMATNKMLKKTTETSSKAEDAQDEIHEASKEIPAKQKMTTGKKASTKASIATGKNTPVPDEDEDEAKDAAKATGRAAQTDVQEGDDDFVKPRSR